MNKYLMLSAAALVATTAGGTTSATAGTAVIVEHNGSVTYCDQIDLSWSGKLYADIHDWTPCGISSKSKGMGVAAGSKKSGKENVSLSDYYVGDVSAGYYVDFQLGLPVKSGKEFNGYYTTDGTGVTQYIAGSYTLGAPGEKHNSPSTIDALRQFIKSHGK